MSKDKFIYRLLRFAAYSCFIVAALLVVWSFVSKIHFLEEKYVEYVNWLADFEQQVAAIGDRWLLVIVVWLLYFIKTAFPLYPISLICVASALVFGTGKALVVNIIGIALMFTVKYIMGTNSKVGSLWLVKKSDVVMKILESEEGTGNPWVLFVCRLLPCMPDNAVSSIYGALGFSYWKYILISIIACIPRLISFIMVGRSVTNPFSLTLSIPLVVIAAASGFTLFGMSKLLNIKDKKRTKRVKSGGNSNV